MYVIVLKSKITSEILGVHKNMSAQPCRFTDAGVAERVAHEMNALSDKMWEEEGLEWYVKKDDGVYFLVRDYVNED